MARKEPFTAFGRSNPTEAKDLPHARASRRKFSSRSMTLPRRSFASSMRPVTLAQHTSLKRINGSLECHARALKRTISICSTFPACLTAWASRIHILGFFGSALTIETVICVGGMGYSQVARKFGVSVHAIMTRQTEAMGHRLQDCGASGKVTGDPASLRRPPTCFRYAVHIGSGAFVFHRINCHVLPRPEAR